MRDGSEPSSLARSSLSSPCDLIHRGWDIASGWMGTVTRVRRGSVVRAISSIQADGLSKIRAPISKPRCISLVLVFSSELPFQSVDDALDTGLKDIGGHAHGAPSFRAIRKDREHPNQRAGASLVIIRN